MRRYFLLHTLLLIAGYTSGQSAWVNEIHYDNEGVDTLEFIEVVFHLDYLTRSDYFILLYDGITGAPYDSAAMNQWIAGDTINSYAFFSWYPAAIQNGPDGIALGFPDSMLQFISYEGAMLATSGLAAGMAGELLPLEETGSLKGYSIQLTGAGSRSEHFWWSSSLQSPGEINQEQQLTTDPVIQYFGDEYIDFGQIPNGIASQPEPYLITGANLFEDLHITIPQGFEADFDVYFGSPLGTGVHQVKLSQDYIAPDTLYLRFRPLGPPDQSYDDSVELRGSGIQQFIHVKGREGPYLLPNVWINEIHYDNVSTDLNEFIELVISDKYLDQVPYLSLHLYNGNNGLEYKQSTGEDWEIGYQDPQGYTYFTARISGIQNGDADGIALAHRFRLIQFISYEGTLTGADGPAKDVLSSDIGVMEETDSPLNSSLQLVGTGGQYDDFTWIYVPGGQTMNQPNHDQVLPVLIKDYQLMQNGKGYWIRWTSLQEYQHAWYILEYSEDGYNYFFLERFMPSGSLPQSYEYKWPDQINGYIRLVQEDTDGKKIYYPPLTRIGNEQDQVIKALRIYTFSGIKVYENYQPEGSWPDLNQLLGSLPSGMYILMINDGHRWEKRKVFKM